MNGTGPETQVSLKVTGSKVLRRPAMEPHDGERVVLEGLGSPAGEEGVKCLRTSARHQISLVQVLPGRGGARLAPGPLCSLALRL